MEPPASVPPSTQKQEKTAVPKPVAPAGPVLRFNFGQDGIGKTRPSEGNPEGPMSVAVDKNGDLLILDQVNDRILRTGKPAIKLPVRHAQDVLALSNGAIAILDRIADRKIALVDATGKVTGSLPLEGKNLKEGGAVTGLFEDRGQIYAEREHGKLVQIGSIAGEASKTREELNGRPSRNGVLLLAAGIVRAAEGTLYVGAIDRATNANRFTRQLSVGEPLDTIAHLDSDASGTIQVVVRLRHQHLLICLNGSDGATLARQSLPISHEPEETFRTFATRDDGTLVQAVLSADGVDYVTHVCR